MLTKEKIEEIRKKIKVQEIDEDIIEKKEWININHIYMKVNRDVYEDLLLFSYSINFLRRIDDNEIRKIIDDNKKIIDECNGYLTDYKIGEKWRLDIFGAKLIEKNNKEINYVIELVFENLLKDEGDEFGEID